LTSLEVLSSEREGKLSDEYSSGTMPTVPNSSTSRFDGSGFWYCKAMPSRFRSLENSRSVDTKGLAKRPPVMVSQS
jgi:hypothetical protein